MKILKSAKRIIAVWMVLSLNWGALALTQTTRAEFVDSAEILGTEIGAGSLDFAVQHSWSYDSDSGCDPQTEICPGWRLTDTVSLATAGTLDFQYTISIVNAAETASSTMPLCDYLTVNGLSLKSFVSAPVQYSTSSVQALVFSLTGNDAALQDQTCNFDYLIQGWQADGVAGYGQGFFVEKTISSFITSDPWMVEAPAVESETGDEGETGGEGGEGGDTGGGSAGASESEDGDIDDTADGDGQIQEQGEENQESEGGAGAEDGDEGDSADNDDSGDDSNGGGASDADDAVAGDGGDAGGDDQQQGSDDGGVDMGQATAGGNENTGGDGGAGSGDGGAGDGGQGSGDTGGGIGGGDGGAGGETGGGSEGGAE